MLEGEFQDIIKNWVKSRVQPDVWETIYEKKYAWSELDHVMLDVIRKTTKLYRRPALRQYVLPMQELEPDGEPVETDVEIEPETQIDLTFEETVLPSMPRSIDSAMARALEYALIGGCMIRPYFQGKDREHMRFEIITPDQLYPMASQLDPTQLEGVAYYQCSPTDYYGLNEITNWYVWDISEDARLMQSQTKNRITEPGFVQIDDSGEVIESFVGDAYPYRDAEGKMVLPWVICRVDGPEDRIYNESVGQDLYDGTIIASWYSIQKEWVDRSQSHKQIVLTGKAASNVGNQVLDPTTPIMVVGDPADAKVEVHELQADTTKFDKSVDKILERLLTRRGQSLERFRESAQRQTAEAQRIQSEGEKDYQLWLELQMDPVERELGEKMRIVWNVANPSTPISTDAEYEIDFADPYDRDPYANLAEKMQLMDAGLKSPLDILEELDPGQTRTEYLAKLENNVRERRLSKGFMSAPTAAVVAATPPPGIEGEVEPRAPAAVEAEIERP
jgi:hypothetical protein